ncbi:MAG: RNA-binding S4 domain-containing protein [Terriglobales bacterium]
MRLDKWLWAARFYKTRALAARACELGRVETAGVKAKPARELRVGDHLRVTTDSATFEVEVAALSEMRGPPAPAQALYREADDARARRLAAQAQAKADWLASGAAPGRPSKRDRRRIHRFRQGE